MTFAEQEKEGKVWLKGKAGELEELSRKEVLQRGLGDKKKVVGGAASFFLAFTYRIAEEKKLSRRHEY